MKRGLDIDNNERATKKQKIDDSGVNSDEATFLDNNDILPLVSRFLSVKQLMTLRQINKHSSTYLMSASDFAWKDRIKNTFPLHYATILEQDVKSQIRWFGSFDTLVEHGWIVRKYVDPTATGDSKFTELTWSKNFLLWRHQNSVGLLDWKKGVVTDQVRLDCKSIDNVFLDNTEKEFACLSDDFKKAYVFSVVDAKLVLQQEYNLSKLPWRKDYNPAGPYMYARCLVDASSFDLEWFSLPDNEFVHSMAIVDPEEDCINSHNCSFAFSALKPEIYAACTGGDGAFLNKIFVIDGVEKSKRLIHESELLIELDTDGQGVMGLDLIENESGRLLHVESCASDIAFNVYEFDGDELQSKLYSQQSHDNSDAEYAENLWYCPGTSFYAVLMRSGALKVIEDTDGEDETSAYWMWEGQTKKSLPYRCYSNVKWLDNDLLCFTFKSKEQTTFKLFSIAATNCVGSIAEDITSALQLGSQIICISGSNDLYVLSRN